MSAHRSAISSASSPLATPTACGTPHQAASSCSNARTSSPRTSQPLLPTRSTAESASSSMSCHWRAKSLARTLVGELFGTGLAYCEQRRTLAPRQDRSDDRWSRLGGDCRIRLCDRGWIRDSAAIGAKQTAYVEPCG